MGLTQLPQIGGILKDYAIARRTAGNLAYALTTWADIGDAALDLVLTAATGDLVEVGVSLIWNSEAVNGHLDVASIVSAAPVNYWGTNGAESASSNGIGAWWGATTDFTGSGAPISRTLVAGDISGGNVTLRIRKRNNTAATKTILATAAAPLVFWAKNYGAV